MAKRKKRGDKERAELGGGDLKQSPFAALAGLAVPDAPVTAAKAPVTPEEAGDEDVLRFDRKVVVRREKKGRGGKTITRISGVLTTHRAAIAELLKKSLGCGASLDGEDVVLHGSLVDRAASWLEEAGARKVVRSS